MKINISNLSEGSHTYSLQGSPDEMELNAPFSGLVNAEVVLEKSMQQIRARVSVIAECRCTCDRCLSEYAEDVAVRYQSMYVWDEREGNETEDESYHVLAPGTNLIDMSQDVREFLSLAVPSKMLCSAECKGMCPMCGTNWNEAVCSCETVYVDDRWSVLQKLRTIEN